MGALTGLTASLYLMDFLLDLLDIKEILGAPPTPQQWTGVWRIPMFAGFVGGLYWGGWHWG